MWGVSFTPWPLFTPGKRPGTVCTGGWVGPRAGLDGGKSRPTGIWSPDLPARSHSLYRLRYPAHSEQNNVPENWLMFEPAVPESPELAHSCHLHFGVLSMAYSNYWSVCFCTAYSILRKDGGGSDQCLFSSEMSEILNYRCPDLTLLIPNYSCEFQQSSPKIIIPQKIFNLQTLKAATVQR